MVGDAWYKAVKDNITGMTYVQEVNYPSTNIHHRHIHIQYWALGHIQIQGSNPIQNMNTNLNIEYNTSQPDEAGKSKTRRAHSPKSSKKP